MKPELVPEALHEDLAGPAKALNDVLNESGRNYDWKKSRDKFVKAWGGLAKGKKSTTFLDKVNTLMGPNNSLPKVLEIAGKATEAKVEPEVEEEVHVEAPVKVEKKGKEPAEELKVEEVKKEVAEEKKSRSRSGARK